jgi:hypothetical protein
VHPPQQRRALRPPPWNQVTWCPRRSSPKRRQTVPFEVESGHFLNWIVRLNDAGDGVAAGAQAWRQWCRRCHEDQLASEGPFAVGGALSHGVTATEVLDDGRFVCRQVFQRSLDGVLTRYKLADAGSLAGSTSPNSATSRVCMRPALVKEKPSGLVAHFDIAGRSLKLTLLRTGCDGDGRVLCLSRVLHEPRGPCCFSPCPPMARRIRAALCPPAAFGPRPSRLSNRR